MARGSKDKTEKRGLLARSLFWVFRWSFCAVLLVAVIVVAFRWVNPPINYYQVREWMRLGAVERDWVAMDQIAPAMARAAVAAEDANFCLHWGVDLDAIQEVIESGSRRGASTITQQVAKNVFLWPDRSFVRKGLEAGFAVVIEQVWGKRRILEVYLNVAEFDTGLFGVEAAAQHYFGVAAKDLTLRQASRLAMVLPSPKTRSAARPTGSQAKRARGIASGAQTIAKDGRSACFDME